VGSPADGQEMIAPLRDRAGNPLFWRGERVGGFPQPSHCRVFSLPEAPLERVIAGDRFYLKPLLSYLGAAAGSTYSRSAKTPQALGATATAD
jgi:hypothetical protein